MNKDPQSSMVRTQRSESIDFALKTGKPTYIIPTNKDDHKDVFSTFEYKSETIPNSYASVLKNSNQHQRMQRE